jgi:hypothetical protein
VGSGGSIPGGSPSTPNGKARSSGKATSSKKGGVAISYISAAEVKRGAAKLSAAKAKIDAENVSGRVSSTEVGKRRQANPGGGTDVYAGFMTPGAKAMEETARAMSPSGLVSFINRSRDKNPKSPEARDKLEAALGEARRRDVNASKNALSVMDPAKRARLDALSPKEVNNLLFTRNRSDTEFTSNELTHAHTIAKNNILAQSGLSAIELDDFFVSSAVTAKTMGDSKPIRDEQTKNILYAVNSDKRTTAWESDPDSRARITKVLGIDVS